MYLCPVVDLYPSYLCLFLLQFLILVPERVKIVPSLILWCSDSTLSLSLKSTDKCIPCQSFFLVFNFIVLKFDIKLIFYILAKIRNTLATLLLAGINDATWL